MNKNPANNHARGFVVRNGDNVATLLEAAEPGTVVLMGEASGRVDIGERVEADHKIAIAAIASGEAVVKNGITIGEASEAIAPGQWVHLHNCRSLYDQRSQSLDLHSGAPGDLSYD